MNKERFISLVKNPALLRVEDGPFLEELLKEFPFFQSAHLLAARCYKVSDSIHLQKQIKTAAAHITDRRVLYNLIENFEPTQQVATMNVNQINSAEKIEIETTIQVDEVIEEVAITSIIEPANEELEMVPEVIVKEIALEEKPTEIISEEIAPLNEAVIELEASISPSENWKDDFDENETQPAAVIEEEKFTDQSILSEGPVSTIEAEIPLEREIKLALAESIYLKEFEQNLIEKGEKSTEKERILLKNAENSSEKNEKHKEKVEKATFEQKEEGTTEFVAWLKKLKDKENTSHKIAEKTAEIETQKEAEKLVEAFMEKPIMRAKPVKQEFFSPVNMAKQSVTDNDFFVTETLAKIYIKQGNLTKAIKVYQNLSLKNPEKNTFFAAQIKILKEQLHNKSGK